MQELAGRSRELEEQHALAAAEAARLQEQVRHGRLLADSDCCVVCVW
jgi:hypothetical protein